MSHRARGWPWGLVAAIVVQSALLPCTANAQTLRGIVHDSAGRPLPDVTLRLVRSSVSARTNAQGEFTLRSRVTGLDTLLVRLIGWQPTQLLFDFDESTDLSWSIALEKQSQRLDSVLTTTERRCPMFTYEAFTCRSRSSVGYKRNVVELAELRPKYWADLFDGLPGVRRISNGAGDFTIEPTTGWRCLVELINGRPVGLTGRVYFTPDVVIGMEYYPSYSEVPEPYKRYAWEPMRITPGNISSFTATCGVVVYWIKGVPLSDSAPSKRF